MLGSLNVVLSDRQALEAIVLVTIVCSKVKISPDPIQKHFYTKIHRRHLPTANSGVVQDGGMSWKDRRRWAFEQTFEPVPIVYPIQLIF